MGVFQLRVRPSSHGAAVSLRRLLDGGREMDLAGVLLVYDRSLTALDGLHQSGRVHGAVIADAIDVGANGAVTLEQPGAMPRGEDLPLIFELQRPLAMTAAAAGDLRALTTDTDANADLEGDIVTDPHRDTEAHPQADAMTPPRPPSVGSRQTAPTLCPQGGGFAPPTQLSVYSSVAAAVQPDSARLYQRRG